MNQPATDTLNKLKKIGRILDSIPAGVQRIHASAILIDSFIQEFGEDGFKEAVLLAIALKKDREQDAEPASSAART